MKQQIAVFLTDTKYGERFAKYLRQIPQSTYEVFYFSDLAACTKFLEQQRADLLILKEEDQGETSLMQRASRVAVLTDQSCSSNEITEDKTPGKEASEIPQIKRIYQYQSMEQILSLLWPSQAISQKETKNNESSAVTADIISLICLNPEIPWFQGLAGAIKGRDGLLVADCAQFVSPEEELQRQKEPKNSYGMSDLIYYLSQEQELTGDHLKRIITKRGGVAFIQPVSQCLDLLELRKEHIAPLISSLEQAGYRTIIFCIPVITKAMAEILRQSRYILYLESGDGKATLQPRLQNQLDEILSEKTDSKFRRILIRQDKDSVNRMQREIAEVLGD